MERQQPEPELRKLTAQEKLDLIYEINLRLFQDTVQQRMPHLGRDPNAWEIVSHESAESQATI